MTFQIQPNVSTKESASVSLTPPATNPGQRAPLFVAREDVFFYTRKWQEGERESADARTRGELRVFETGKDFSAWLDA